MSLAQLQSINRVLVANRGEIALRVMRACKELGVESVAVYGEGEEFAPHVRYADDAFRLKVESGLPYLASRHVIDAAIQARADAIHPGYGFLAENAGFAEAVADRGLILIGPSPHTIATMGDKVESRRVAMTAGIEPVPGTSSPVESAEEARQWADEHGYPVAVKAAGGGGGRGFRVARAAAELEGAFVGSRGEAERYFSNPSVYLERYLEHPRHVEVQVFGDQHGHIVALGERDCSIQRRHQKLVEESPSPGVTPQLRRELMLASEKLAASVSYVGAGTIEYLLDQDGRFYFLEMNTRIQVEHTVTEMVTGIDLVKEQIRVAAGEPLTFNRNDWSTRGWAIECRINAEDAGRDFAPTPGPIVRYQEPSGFGIRVDSAVSAGDAIVPAYDSLIAKVIAWGRDRDEAVARMRRALADFEIAGTATTLPFHARVLRNEVFLAGAATTTFIEDCPDVRPAPYVGEGDDRTPDTASRRIPASKGEGLDLLVEVNGRSFQATVSGLPKRHASTGRRRPVSVAQERRSGRMDAMSGNELVSSVQGTVIRIERGEGENVEIGDIICVVEAMKMENELVAHRAGTLVELNVAIGASISIGTVIGTIDDAPR